MNSFDSFYHENFGWRRLGWQTLMTYWIQGLQRKDFDIADFCWKIGKDLPCVVRLKSRGALLRGKRPLQMFIFRFVTKLMSAVAISLCRIPFVRKTFWLIMIYCLLKLTLYTVKIVSNLYNSLSRRFGTKISLLLQCVVQNWRKMSINLNYWHH